MLKKITNLIYLVFFIYLFLFFLCSATLLSAEAKETSKDKKSRVRLVKMTRGDINILGKKLGHPGKFSVEELKKALTSLHYEEKILLTWGKKKPVFRKKTISRFAPLIQKAVLKVKPHFKVSFTTYNSGEKTTGYIFARGDTLIFKFKTIRGIPYLHDAFSVKSEAEAEVLTNWRLFPGPDQQFYSYKGFLGIPKKQKTMIVANLKKSKGADKRYEDKSNIDVPVKNKKPDQHKKRRSFEKKLRYLKDLKQKNLITEDAYQKKVEELLDQL